LILVFHQAQVLEEYLIAYGVAFINFEVFTIKPYMLEFAAGVRRMLYELNVMN
jgi:hypothetical protein